MKILLIDDSWEFTKPVKYLLEIDRHIVDVIDEADDAYDWITMENGNSEKYKLIILDIMFTLGDKFSLENDPEVGIFLYRKIREFYKEIPIIIVSALNKEQFKKYFDNDKYLKYVSKPLSRNIEELKTAIRELTL